MLKKTEVEKFMNELIKKEKINESELAYEFSSEDEKYYIYHLLFEKMFSDDEFSMRFDDLVDNFLKGYDSSKFELIESQSDLIRLNTEKKNTIENIFDSFQFYKPYNLDTSHGDYLSLIPTSDDKNGTYKNLDNNQVIVALFI